MFWKVSVQVWPPFSVRYIRNASGVFPIDMITAVSASNASMSRNWRPSAPGGPTDCQEAPRFVVLNTLPARAAPVPCQPLTHAVCSLTAEAPRNLAVASVGVGVSCQP